MRQEAREEALGASPRREAAPDYSLGPPAPGILGARPSKFPPAAQCRPIREAAPVYSLGPPAPPGLPVPRTGAAPALPRMLAALRPAKLHL